ncbi:cytochrome P450 [Glycomyces sp. A-F 0318]|uniref:cytochrome P450 n=1 Tax=Glycomyces amatae TaxID=2881355 RepID=UPI001E35F6E2|nr:cytochrome P450 [Glycomyces amatae]MCD0446804.1 cytochrome P450 [Glycomyces amatae]
MDKTAAEETRTPSHAGTADTLGVAARVFAPIVAAGAVKRRPKAMAFAERRQTDRAAIDLLRRLRGEHGPGPLVLSVPKRTVAVLLDHGDVGRVLDQTPAQFTPDTVEKHAALGRFQRHGPLLSRGRDRERRRPFNETVLDQDRPLHHLAEPLWHKVTEECDRLAEAAGRSGRLAWRDFEPVWARLVRRVVFGDAAADDRGLTALLDSLRREANWAYLRPRHESARAELADRLLARLEPADPGSLAGAVADAAPGPEVHPEDQVAHWLFAYDAAALVLMRTLAALSAHPGPRHGVRTELAAAGASGPEELPYLRACVLESLRLWPTTPLLLRDATADTEWGGEVLPAGTSFVVYTPLFHRDPERLPYADRFTPRVWLDGTADAEPAMTPFSGGPARCPGRNLVLFTVTTALAALLRRNEYRPTATGPLVHGRPEPATLNPYSMVFTPTAA